MEGDPMARRKGGTVTTATASASAKKATRTGQARLELPSEDMDRLRRAARSIGLSLSAFIRQAVLEKAADVERRMGL
jgi:uncharacterized protein (DUF1778 family)